MDLSAIVISDQCNLIVLMNNSFHKIYIKYNEKYINLSIKLLPHIYMKLHVG